MKTTCTLQVCFTYLLKFLSEKVQSVVVCNEFYVSKWHPTRSIHWSDHYSGCLQLWKTWNSVGIS